MSTLVIPSYVKDIPRSFHSLVDYYEYCTYWSIHLGIPKIHAEWTKKCKEFDVQTQLELTELFSDFFPDEDSIGNWHQILNEGIKYPQRWNAEYFSNRKLYQALKWLSKQSKTKSWKVYWEYIHIALSARNSYWSTRTNYQFFEQVVAKHQSGVKLNPIQEQHLYLSTLETQLKTYRMNRIVYEDIYGTIRRESIVKWDDVFHEGGDGVIETRPISFYYGISGPLWDSFEIVRYRTESGKIIEVPIVMILRIESDSEIALNDGDEEDGEEYAFT